MYKIANMLLYYCRVRISGRYSLTAVHVTSSPWVVMVSCVQSHGPLIILLIRTMGPVSCYIILQVARDIITYFVDIFRLEAGRQAGQFIIYTYGLYIIFGPDQSDRTGLKV